MREFLIELIGISLPTSAVILLILAFSKRIKRSFSAACRYFIWLVIIIRLAIPFGGIFLPSLIEIPVYEAEYNEQENEKTPIDPPVSAPVSGEIQYTPETNTTPSPIVPDDPSGSTVEPEQITPETGTVSQNTPAIEKEPEDDKGFEFDPSMIAPALFFLWAAGAVSFIASDLIKYNIYLVRTKKALAVPDEITISVYNEICSEMNIRKAPALYVSSVFQSPLLCGYFKKRIIIPNISLSDESLRRVLAHELTHHRRGDLWTKLLARFANAIHWFNPLAYVAVSRFYREMELSCDEKVISALSEEERILYGKTMLDIVKNCKNVESVLTTKFDPKKKSAGERIENIVGCEKKKRGIIIICTVVALCLVAGVVIGVNIISADNKTDAKDNNEKNDPEKGEYSVRLWSDDGSELWAKNEEALKGGENEPLKLVSGKTEIYFTGSFNSHIGSRTRYYNTDVTGDGKKDHVLILPTVSGTGVKGEEIHVFDGKKHKEISTQEPLEYLSSLITFSSDDDNYYASFNGQTKKYRKDLFYSYGTDHQLDTPLLECGWLEYNVDETKEGTSSITASFLVSVSKANLDGIGVCRVNFSYSKKALVCESFDFSDLNGMCETNSEKWFVRAYGSQVILVSDEKRYVIKLQDFSEHEDRLPSAHISSDEIYCVLTYYDSSYSDGDTQMMCATVVYLNSGNIKDLYADQLADILSYHELTEEDISEYIPKNKSRLTHTLEVEETDSSSLVIHSKIVSDDEKLKLCGHYIAAPFYMYYDNEYIVDSTDMENYHSEPEMPEKLNDIDDVPPGVANAVTAFINKDTKALEKLLGCRDGVLRQYADFEFGKYSFSYKDGTLELKVEVKKSSLPDVQPGSYTVEFSIGRFADVHMSGLGNYNANNKNQEFTTTAEKYVYDWIGSTGLWDFSAVEAINASDDSLYKADLVMFMDHYDKDIDTVEEYKEAARAIFGIEDLDIPDRLIEDNGTVIDSWGHGGSVRTYKKAGSETDPDTGIITVYVQTYADFAGTVRSHIYEYKFEDHGNYLKVIYSGIYEKSEYEPEARYMG